MSRRLLLYTASSLDGFIARPDGGIDWLDSAHPAPDGGDYGYAEFVSTVDTTVMGMKTFEFARSAPQAENYFKPFRNIVFTRHPSDRNFPHTTFVSGDIPEFVRRLKAENGKNIWLMGGGQINGLLLKADLIDEMVLSYIPCLLGEGIPLFAPPASERRLILVKQQSWENGVVQMVLRPAS